MEQTSPLPNLPTPPQISTTPSVNSPSSNKPVLMIFLIISVLILVSLNAYLFTKLQNQPKAPVTPPTPVVQASPTPTLLPAEASAKEGDPTANWKTYNSPEMHFQIKYPNDVSVNSGIVNKQNNISISYKGKYQNNNTAWVDGITIDITFNPTDLPLNDSIKKIINDQEKSFPNIFKPAKDVIIDNISGYQVDRILDNGINDIYLPYNESAYLLINISVMDSHKLGYQKIADQILSTFKFLD